MIYWLESGAKTPTQNCLVTPLEDLRVTCNQTLYLGLASLEGHYAIYEAGAFYSRHLDAFRDDDSRVLSVVLYLNDHWQQGDGGELVLYAPEAVIIEPMGGTLVVFLSRDIEHEVLESHTMRKSYVGWFKRNRL